MSPARNPLAYHSDYFGACAVEANGAPRPFLRCRAARGPPGSSAAWRRRFTRAGEAVQWARAKKSAAGPATALVGAPCYKRVKATAPVVLLPSVLPLVGECGTCRRVFRAILRQPQRRMCAVSGAGEAEEHAIFAGRLLSACGACSTTHAVIRCVRVVKLQPTRRRRERTR